MSWFGELLDGMTAYAGVALLVFGYWLFAGWAVSFLLELPFKKDARRVLVGFLPGAALACVLLGLAADRGGPHFRVIHFSWWMDAGIIAVVGLSFLAGRVTRLAAGLGVVCVLVLTGWVYVRGLTRIYANLSRETRIAEITVERFEEGSRFMVVSFVRIRDDDKRLPAEFYRIEGDKVWVQAGVVKFKQENALLGGRSIYVFRSIYGDLEAPASGARLDTAGEIPEGKKLASAPPDLLERISFPVLERMEKEIWKEFLWLSQNEFQSDKVDAAFDVAVGKHLRQDRVYQVSIQHNGSLLFRTVGMRMPPVTEASNPGDEDA